MTAGKISIVVPVYNVEKYLERCVSSIVSQSYRNLEVILVDDGSTDASGVCCDRLAETDSRITVVHQENQGLGPARNAGLDRITGEYVAFVDSDDWVEADTYEVLYNALQTHHCEIAACGRKTVVNGTVRDYIFCLPEEKVLDGHEAVRKYLLQSDLNMSACDKLFRAELFDGIRFPGEHLVSEDIVPVYNVLKKTNRVVLTGKPLYNYFSREGSLSRSAFNKRILGMYQYARVVARDAEENFPEFADEAACFEFDLLISVYRYIRSSGYHGPEKKEVLRELRNKLPEILRNHSLMRKQQAFALLAVVGCDRIPDILYKKWRQIRR